MAAATDADPSRAVPFRRLLGVSAGAQARLAVHYHPRIDTADFRSFVCSSRRESSPFAAPCTTHNREVNDRERDRRMWYSRQLAMRIRIIAAGLILLGFGWVPAGTSATDVRSAQCVRPSGAQGIAFSGRKFLNVRRHFRGAVRRGWPRRLVVNRRGADARRERVLRDIPTREGFDRDEYPPRLAEGVAQGWSVVTTRAAGRPTCATCPALRTAHTARRSETDSSSSATAPAFATCSADSFRGVLLCNEEAQPDG